MTAKQDMINQDLAGKIRHGIYPPKSFLPSENELANLYGASRNTVRKSLEDLTSLGLIQKIKGKGSIVLDFSRLSFPISRITTFNELNQSLGLKAETKLLEIKEVKKVPDDFSCDNTEPFIKVKRLRIIDGEPDVLDVDYISTKYVKEISPSVAEHSLYDYFENELGLKISYAVKDVSVQTVSEELAKMLELDPDRKAVLVKSMVYLEDTSLFQLTASYHNPNRFRFIDFARRSKI